MGSTSATCGQLPNESSSCMGSVATLDVTVPTCMSLSRCVTLADLGVDELVVVDGPPEDAAALADLVAALADTRMSALR